MILDRHTGDSLTYSFLGGVHTTYITRPTETDMILTLNICKRKKIGSFGGIWGPKSSVQQHPLFWPKQSIFKTGDGQSSGDILQVLYRTLVLQCLPSITNHFQGSDYLR